MPKLTLDIIGRVRNSIRHKKREGWENVSSEIALLRRYEPAMDGLEDYSHAFILFWLSRVPKGKRLLLKIHPRSRTDLPLVGVFATRSQYRPNPIGLTVVKVLGRKKNILRVKGLDALNGTPVLDIKPISPRQEFFKNYAVPGWYEQLWKKEK